MPEMVGSIVGVYQGKTFNQVKFMCILRVLSSDVSSPSFDTFIVNDIHD